MLAMKKLLLLSALALVFLQQSKSQVFAPIGAKWYLSQVNWFGPLPIVDTAYVSESIADTIINGINCRKVNIRCACCDAQFMYVYDSNDTVYRYHFDLNRFAVLFNFNLNAGDSMYVVINENPDSVLVHIDSVGYLTINSQIRKIQYGGSMPQTFWFYGPFVEGVGSLQSIIPLYGTCDPLSGPLRCYEDTILGLYNTGQHTSCDSLYVIYTSVNDIDNAQPETNVFPNPFHESATLTLNVKNIREGYLEIRNALGKVITGEKYFSGNKIELKRSNLQPGIYFYRIRTNQKEYIHGRFIIE